MQQLYLLPNTLLDFLTLTFPASVTPWGGRHRTFLATFSSRQILVFLPQTMNKPRPEPDRKDTLPNNIGTLSDDILLIIDPAHQQVNPSVVDDHVFKSNSHHYGSGASTGGSSSWDAIPKPKETDTKHLEPVLSTDSETGHRAYHGVTPATASINNVLGNVTNDLTGNAPELGKQRSGRPTDPASRSDHHKPSAKEKVLGELKVIVGKVTGDQDLLSSGEALRDGNMERGCK
jgi:hypothetical protein